jgi:F420-0:gamma-glutamyl ligase
MQTQWTREELAEELAYLQELVRTNGNISVPASLIRAYFNHQSDQFRKGPADIYAQFLTAHSTTKKD